MGYSVQRVSHRPSSLCASHGAWPACAGQDRRPGEAPQWRQRAVLGPGQLGRAVRSMPRCAPHLASGKGGPRSCQRKNICACPRKNIERHTAKSATVRRMGHGVGQQAQQSPAASCARAGAGAHVEAGTMARWFTCDAMRVDVMQHLTSSPSFFVNSPRGRTLLLIDRGPAVGHENLHAPPPLVSQIVYTSTK